jgi:hypothetical protein
MTYYHKPKLKTRLINYKEKESSGDQFQHVATTIPATVRDRKKLAISTYKPPRILPLYKPGHDKKRI